MVPTTVTSDGERVVVVTPDGMGVAPHDDPSRRRAPTRPTNPADLVEQPAKVMRIGSMVKQLLEEVRSAPLDEKGRARLAEIHERSIAELEDGLAPELVEELERITLPFKDDVALRRRAAHRPGPARRAGWRACSTASRRRSSRSRWPRRRSCSRCAQLPPGTTPPGVPSPGGPGDAAAPAAARASRATPRAPASTSDPDSRPRAGTAIRRSSEVRCEPTMRLQ